MSQAELDGVAIGSLERAGGERKRSDRGRAASVGAPDPELVERPRRRRFTAEHKLQIVREADACTRPGQVGALLRREGLYSSLLTEGAVPVTAARLRRLSVRAAGNASARRST